MRKRDRHPATPARRTGPRVALVHDWLTGMRGGEKVLEAIGLLYPDAPLFTLVHVPRSVSGSVERHRIRPTVTRLLPAVARKYRSYLPLFPAAVECFDLDEFDLVISSSHCAVKSVVRTGKAVHICYCHSPMRYAWDQFDAYFGPERTGRLASGALRHVMAGLARWDAATAGRVDRYVANSQYVAGRIRRYYNRGSTVVYPPVDTDFYRPADDARTPDSNFLIVSALVPYKRIDLAIDACRRAGVPLTVVGRGPEEARLARLGGDVRFVGWRKDEEIRDLYRCAAGVLLPGVEDFGMVPVEAQACGCPVVALDAGGARETVVHERTGVLVREHTVDAFAAAIDQCRHGRYDRREIRSNAERFSPEHFLSGFQAVVDSALAGQVPPR